MSNPANQNIARFDFAACARAEMIREAFRIGEPDGAAEQLAQIRRRSPRLRLACAISV